MAIDICSFFQCGLGYLVGWCSMIPRDRGESRKWCLKPPPSYLLPCLEVGKDKNTSHFTLCVSVCLHAKILHRSVDSALLRIEHVSKKDNYTVISKANTFAWFQGVICMVQWSNGTPFSLITIFHVVAPCQHLILSSHGPQETSNGHGNSLDVKASNLHSGERP